MSKPSSSRPGDKKSIWAIVPAAGVGQRMHSDTPKQYLHIDSKPVLQWTLERLLSVNAIHGVVVAVKNDDNYWDAININSNKLILRADGGEERYHSVINAMQLLAKQRDFDQDNGWVLVHDAVRPCVSVTDIEKLISEAMSNDSGGILATPVRDTMKRQGKTQVITSTVERDGLWHALTPQCFPFKVLLAALIQADNEGLNITDDSSAMEYAGYTPKLIHGSDTNIKITRPEDLAIAEKNLLMEQNN